MLWKVASGNNKKLCLNPFLSQFPCLICFDWVKKNQCKQNQNLIWLEMF